MRKERFLDSDLIEIRLSRQELATLTRAAEILARLRDIREHDDDDMGVDIALAHYTCAELAAEPFIR